MYTEKQVIPLFRKACPGWERELAKKQVAIEKNNPGLFISMAALARFIVTSYQNGTVKDFPKLFNTLELVLQEGTEKAKELVIVGLIENIQTIAVTETLETTVFKKWLKEESLKAWQDLELFWKRKGEQ